MSGALLHSPADIISKLIESLALGSDPTTSGTWPAFVDTEPDEPDNCLTVRNTTGEDNGRTQYDGERQESHGVQVTVRATTSPKGYIKARAIAIAFDQQVYDETVHLANIDVSGNSTYLIHSIKRSGDVNPIGKETPSSHRMIHTVNFLVYVTQLS